MKESGFSLIEVTLALAVVALGLLGVFHLFPVGLRASFDATAETRVGQFADEVFNQLYAEASAETDTAAWSGVFAGALDIDLDESRIYPNGTSFGGDILLDGRTMLVEYPVDSEEYLRCRVWSGTTDGLLATAKLDVAYGRVGGFTNTFYTEVYNFGM